MDSAVSRVRARRSLFVATLAIALEGCAVDGALPSEASQAQDPGDDAVVPPTARIRHAGDVGTEIEALGTAYTERQVLYLNFDGAPIRKGH